MCFYMHMCQLMSGNRNQHAFMLGGSGTHAGANAIHNEVGQPVAVYSISAL